MVNYFTEQKRKHFIETILLWAKSNLRDYPWRTDRSTYKVFISEFFLQRTRSDQVLPVYMLFLDKYPNFEVLKTAKKEDLILYFKKLGLLKRIEYLTKIIDIIKKKGGFEELNPNEIIALPGIGEYTSSAIQCFAFNENVALVDSNIIRIFERYFDFKTDIRPARKDQKIWDFATSILPNTSIDIYNYALIDFGSLVCIPKKPSCSSCPLQSECNYFSNN